MSRIIKPSNARNDRMLLEKGIVQAIHELSLQPEMDETTKDLLAFISLSLTAIGDTIDPSVIAWEKRGYWIKADRFRMEWSWSISIAEEMKQAILVENWERVLQLTGHVTQKLSKVKINNRSHSGTPWIGFYQKLISSNKNLI